MCTLNASRFTYLLHWVCCHKNMFEVTQTRKQQICEVNTASASERERERATKTNINRKTKVKKYTEEHVICMHTNTSTCTNIRNTSLVKLHRCAFIHSYFDCLAPEVSLEGIADGMWVYLSTYPSIHLYLTANITNTTCNAHYIEALAIIHISCIRTIGYDNFLTVHPYYIRFFLHIFNLIVKTYFILKSSIHRTAHFFESVVVCRCSCNITL